MEGGNGTARGLYGFALQRRLAFFGSSLRRGSE